MKKAFLGVFMGLGIVIFVLVIGSFVMHKQGDAAKRVVPPIGAQQVDAQNVRDTQESPLIDQALEASDIDLTRLVDSYAVIMRGFAPNSDPKHLGADVHAPGDVPRLFSRIDGTVVISGACNATWCDGMGNMVVVERADGAQVLYAHLDSTVVSVGDKVAQGQVVGVMGQTGAATGVHVHAEYCKTSCENRDVSNFRDPMDLLR